MVVVVVDYRRGGVVKRNFSLLYSFLYSGCQKAIGGKRQLYREGSRSGCLFVNSSAHSQTGGNYQGEEGVIEPGPSAVRGWVGRVSPGERAKGCLGSGGILSICNLVLGLGLERSESEKAAFRGRVSFSFPAMRQRLWEWWLRQPQAHFFIPCPEVVSHQAVPG